MKHPTFIEVSHPVQPGMKTYPGLPVPKAEILLDYEASRANYDNQAEFRIASLHLCGNSGTYVDAPCHRHRGGRDLAGLPLTSLAHLPVVLIDASRAMARGLGPDLFRGLDFRSKAVLVATGWSRFWATDHYFERSPFLTAQACDVLLQGGACFVGIDSLNIDDVEDPRRPAHTKLLGAGVPVCEHMTNLEKVPPAGGFLHAVPITWVGGASFPVRAYVIKFD